MKNLIFYIYLIVAIFLITGNAFFNKYQYQARKARVIHLIQDPEQDPQNCDEYQDLLKTLTLLDQTRLSNIDSNYCETLVN
jgi:hypothetical protein